MRSTDPTRPVESDNERALPRAVVRLLRSGSLDPARTRRVLEVHGIDDTVALAWAIPAKPEA
jgi:hypothetical protein